MIGMVEYGVGNVGSLGNALRYLGLPFVLSADTSELDHCDRLILPGVGAFGPAMERLSETGLIPYIESRAEAGRPLLGICLGMQLLLSASHERGQYSGLGLIPGQLQSLRTQALLVDQYVDQPHLERLSTGHPSSGEQHQGCRLPTDQSWQGDGQAEALMETQLDEIRGEAGLRGRDPEIGYQGQAQATADRGTLNGTDDGGSVGEQPGCFPIENSGGVPEPFLGKIATPGIVVLSCAEIRTGAEVFSLRCKHDCAAIGVFVRRIECIGDLTDQTVIKEIGRRPLDFHGGHVVRMGHGDVGESGESGHMRPLRRAGNTSSEHEVTHHGARSIQRRSSPTHSAGCGHGRAGR